MSVYSNVQNSANPHRYNQLTLNNKSTIKTVLIQLWEYGEDLTETEPLQQLLFNMDSTKTTESYPVET